jgi:hypothetical protein
MLTDIVNKLPAGALGFLLLIALILLAVIICSAFKHLAILVRGYPPVDDDEDEDGHAIFEFSHDDH